MTDSPVLGLIRLSQPAVEPLTVAEAKTFLRVGTSNDDTLIGDIITAVRETAEEYLHKSLITQSWKLTLEDYAPTILPLARGPVQSITSVKAVTKTGGETTINSALYHLSGARDALHCDSVVMGHEVQIIYVTGFGDAAADVPEAIRQGMRIHIAALYDDRLGGTEIPERARALYQPYRMMRLG